MKKLLLIIILCFSGCNIDMMDTEPKCSVSTSQCVSIPSLAEHKSASWYYNVFVGYNVSHCEKEDMIASAMFTDTCDNVTYPVESTGIIYKGQYLLYVNFKELVSDCETYKLVTDVNGESCSLDINK